MGAHHRFYKRLSAVADSLGGVRLVTNMARPKRNRSRTIDNAQTRAAALSAIEPPLNVGESLSLAAFQAQIADAREKLARYNNLLAASEEARVVFASAEKALAQHYTRMLAAVAAAYGKDSEAYATAGGTLLRNRKRPVRKTASSNSTLLNAA